MQLSKYFNIIGRTSDPEVRFMQKSGLPPKKEGLAYLTDKKKRIITIAQCLQAFYILYVTCTVYIHSVNSPAVSTEAVGFAGRTIVEDVGETLPKETTSVVSVI